MYGYTDRHNRRKAVPLGVKGKERRYRNLKFYGISTLDGGEVEIQA